MVELPRENGKRRFFCKSLKTYNYYEAREKAKIMAERLENMNTAKFMDTLNCLWDQVVFEPIFTPLPNGTYAFARQRIKDTTLANIIERLAELENYIAIIKRNELSSTDKITFNQYLHYLPEIKDLLEKNNEILKQQITNPVTSQPQAINHTIGEILVLMVKSKTNTKPESDRKYRALKQTIEGAGLTLDSDYLDFYKPDILNKVTEVVENNKAIQGDTKRKYMRHVKELIKYANVLEPDVYKTNLIHTLRDIEKTSKHARRPHFPYSQDQLLEIFDPKHDFFKKNPDQFWTCMIALFTGSRQNAAMTLQYKDVINTGNLDCIQFIEDHPIKHLKTDASERIVPIPAQLLDLGFVDYVRNRQKKLKATGTDFIFPKCQTSGGNENNKFAVRGVLKFLSDIGIRTNSKEKLDFHSFRKNASIQLQNAGVPNTFINDIIGWEGENIMEQSYSNHRLPEIKEQADKLRYDFLQPHFDQWKVIMAKI